MKRLGRKKSSDRKRKRVIPPKPIEYPAEIIYEEPEMPILKVPTTKCTFCEFTYTQPYKYRIHLLLEHILDSDSDDDEPLDTPIKSSTDVESLFKNTLTKRRDTRGKEKDGEFIYTKMSEKDISKAIAEADKQKK